MLDIDATLTRKIVKYIRGSKTEQTRSKPWNIFSSKFFYRYDSPFYTCNSWSLRSFFPFSFFFSHLVRRLRVHSRNKIVPCVSTDSSRDERKEATKKLASHGGDFSDNAAQRSRELGTGSFYEGDLLTEIKRGYVIREIVEARTAI